MILGIELGSNTLRAALMDSNYEIIKSKEFIVASAAGLKSGGSLDMAAKERIIEALCHLSLSFDFTAPYVAVATEAFRMARDSELFFDEIYVKFGIKFHLISGQSEAKLTRLGILNRLKALERSADNALFVDLGGASTELSFGDSCGSFKFGILRFYQDGGASDMTLRANLTVKEAVEFMDKFSFSSAVLTAGVATSLVALRAGMDYENYDAGLINGQILHYDEFMEIAKVVSKMSAEQGNIRLGKGRAPLVVCGLYLLAALFKNHTKIPFVVVDDGLREGVCIAYLRGLFGKFSPNLIVV